MPVTNRAKPRWETKPTPRSKTWQRDIWRTADRLKTPLMPWQKKGARLLAELSEDLCSGTGPCAGHDPKPLPRYKIVIVSVPRQQGKTVVSRAAVTTVAESDDYLELYGTAQSRQYAAKHVVKLGQALRRVDPSVKVLAGVGNEAVRFRNGSTYSPISPSEGGGHGDSIDFMLIDEGWAVEQVTMGGITPAMIARPHSQMLVISTMGTVDSGVWNGLVELGRSESIEPTGERIAYIEYSASTDEEVFEDVCTEEGQAGCVWGRWMPALGLTVTHQDIRTAIKTMMADPSQGASEVVRAFGNRTVATLVTLFPTDWVTKAERVVDPMERMVLSLDVNESPPGATVTSAAIDADGKAASRVLEYRTGSPRWVAEYLRQVIRDRDVESVVVDLNGPARQIAAELRLLCEDEVVPLVDRVPRDFAADCQAFYDDLREGRLALHPEGVLAEAIAGARRKDLSDTGLWVVSRGRMSVDASPLIATIMGLALAKELELKPKSSFFIY